MTFSCKGIDHRSELLVGQVLQVKGKVGRASNGEVRPDAATMLSTRGDEETHWTSNFMTLVGPLAPGSSTTRGARFDLWRGDVVGDGSQDPFCFVSGDDALVQGDGPWVFGENAPSQL